MQTVEAQKMESVLGQFEDQRANLIPILQEIQAKFYYLPEEVLRRVARKLRVPLPEVYQVATFYRCFSLKPRGKHLVQVCLGTACHVRGGDRVLERTQTETGIVSGNTSPDVEFTVEPVRCLGCCGLAPVMRVDKQTFAHIDQTKVRGVIGKFKPQPKRAAAAAAKESVAHD